MRFKRALAFAGSAALLALVWPAASPANHVSVEASVVAILKERAASGAWLVEVSFFVRCNGAGAAGAFYSGNLSLVDEQTRESIYLGGVSSASGTVRQIVAAKSYWRQMHPVLKISCGDNATLHGSATIEVTGPAVIVPALDGDGEGGGGSGGGGGGGGAPAGAIRRSRCGRAAASGHSWGRTNPTRSPGAAQEMSSLDAAGATAFTGATATIA